MSVAIVPDDPAWPTRFDQERRLLERVLAPWLDGGIHHIGSTSIAGLAAKPIIHMMAGVTLAREYEALKLTLAEQHDAGVVEYTAGKRAFVARVLESEGIALRRDR